MRKILIPIVDKIHILSENLDPIIFQARNKETKLQTEIFVRN